MPEKFRPDLESLSLPSNEEESLKRERVLKAMATEKSQKTEQKLTNEDMQAALEEFDKLIDWAKGDQNISGSLGKYTVKVLALGANFPHTIKALGEALINATNKHKVEARGENYVPLGKAIKNVLNELLTNYQKTNELVNDYSAEGEIKRLIAKAEELDRDDN